LGIGLQPRDLMGIVNESIIAKLLTEQVH
jgi:hypothetical protein